MQEKLKIKCQKLSPNAILPEKAHSTDAGFDLFYAGTESMTIPPFGNAKLGTGWRMEIPEGWCVLVKNRSGVATKKGLLIGACVSPEQNILTNKGYFSAATLTNRFVIENNIKVASFDKELKQIIFVEFTGFSISGREDIWKIEFDDGSEIEITQEHLLLNENLEWRSPLASSEDCFFTT